MRCHAVVAGIENGARGWRVKLQVFPGTDVGEEERLHRVEGLDPFVFLRVPISASEARAWGAVAGATVEMALTLDPHDRATMADTDRFPLRLPGGET